MSTSRLGLIIQGLTQAQREKLDYALANTLSQYVEYKPGRYVGVFADNISYLQPEIRHGHWSEGTITR